MAKTFEAVMKRSWIFTLLVFGGLLAFGAEFDEIFDDTMKYSRWGLIIFAVIMFLGRNKIPKFGWHNIVWHKAFEGVLLLIHVVLEAVLAVSFFTASRDILSPTITSSRFFVWYAIACMVMGGWATILNDTISLLKGVIVSFCFSPVFAGILIYVYKRNRLEKKSKSLNDILNYILKKEPSEENAEIPSTNFKDNLNIGVGALVLALLLFSAFGGPSARDCIENGNKYYAERKYDKAIDEYSKAVEINAKKTKAYIMRGNAYHAKERYDEAIADYSKAIELDSRNAIVFINRGNTYQAKKEYRKAIDDYGKAMSIDPENISARYGRASAYLGREDYANALADYTVIINNERATDKYAVYAARGEIYHKQKDFVNAVANYSKAIELFPMDSIGKSGTAFSDDAAILLASYYKGRSDSYAMQNNLQQAIADVSKALEFCPDDSELYKTRAELHRKLGNTKQAEADTEKATGWPSLKLK